MKSWKKLVILLTLATLFSVLPANAMAKDVPPSSKVSASTEKAPVTSGVKKLENVNGGVRLTWTKVSGAKKYRVLRKTGSGKWQKLCDTTKLSLTDKKVKSGVKYTYTIRCLSKNGKYIGTYNKKGKAITYVAAPAVKKAESTKSGIKLTWSKSAGAAKYRILRKAGSGSWKKIGDTNKLTFVDKTAKKGTKYTYTVCCISKDGKKKTSAFLATGKTAKLASAGKSSSGKSEAVKADVSDSVSSQVYITKTGSKYHRSGCRHLSRSKIGISRSDAIARGYDPCSVCNP